MAAPRQPRLWIGVTDHTWLQHLKERKLSDVNFWSPSGLTFGALVPGELFLFKLHAPHHAIAGGGFFVRAQPLPLSVAWQAFGDANGAETGGELKARIGRYARVAGDPVITCIILSETFYLERSEWIAVPPDFAKNIVRGKGYALDSPSARILIEQVADRLQHRQQPAALRAPATDALVASARYGKSLVVLPRLGQTGFRSEVIAAYGRCAITNEKTLPVLEAAHIKPYSLGGDHQTANGILLRSDLHRLYDQGYLTIDPDDRHLVVSGAIRKQYRNGRHYYELEGQRLADPMPGFAPPSAENLRWHAEHIFVS